MWARPSACTNWTSAKPAAEPLRPTKRGPEGPLADTETPLEAQLKIGAGGVTGGLQLGRGLHQALPESLPESLPLDLQESLPDFLPQCLDPPQRTFFTDLGRHQPPLTLNISSSSRTRISFLHSARWMGHRIQGAARAGRHRSERHGLAADLQCRERGRIRRASPSKRRAFVHTKPRELVKRRYFHGPQAAQTAYFRVATAVVH